MKVLIIGGNRFVGLRLSHLLDREKGVDLSIINRTGQAAHVKNAAIYKGDRRNLQLSQLDRDWDLIYDFACYDEFEARQSLEYFKTVGRYVMISTASVYGDGAHLTEEDFDPSQVKIAAKISAPIEPGAAYQFGKQRAEAVFVQEAPFSSLRVRFPYIVGPDDYTDRFQFYVRRLENGQPIYTPSLTSNFSLIQSEDAARFLHWALTAKPEGALNVASPDSLTLQHLLESIRHVVGKKAILVNQQTSDNRSPYSLAQDKAIDTTRLIKMGFKIPETRFWLRELVGELSSKSTAPQVH